MDSDLSEPSPEFQGPAAWWLLPTWADGMALPITPKSWLLLKDAAAQGPAVPVGGAVACIAMYRQGP